MSSIRLLLNDGDSVIDILEMPAGELVSIDELTTLLARAIVRASAAADLSMPDLLAAMSWSESKRTRSGPSS